MIFSADTAYTVCCRPAFAAGRVSTPQLYALAGRVEEGRGALVDESSKQVLRGSFDEAFSKLQDHLVVRLILRCGLIVDRTRGRRPSRRSKTSEVHRTEGLRSSRRRTLLFRRRVRQLRQGGSSVGSIRECVRSRQALSAQLSHPSTNIPTVYYANCRRRRSYRNARKRCRFCSPFRSLIQSQGNHHEPQLDSCASITLKVCRQGQRREVFISRWQSR